MPKLLRFSFTLSDSSYADQEILKFIDRFASGKGKQERSIEIKRLLRAAIEQETMARNFGGLPYAGRTIQPTLIAQDRSPAMQDNPQSQALPIGKPKPAVQIPVVTSDESAGLPSQPQDAGDTTTNPVSASPPANDAMTMYGFLMEALADEEKRNPI